MGFDRDEVEALAAVTDDIKPERIARNNRSEETGGLGGGDSTETDTSMQEVDFYECYLKVDYNDDGKAELRKIQAAGPELEIFSNEEWDEVPIVMITPIRMPHKLTGRAIAEAVEDIQRIKSTLIRQVLNNLYNLNNARTAISEKVSVEDMLDNRVAGIVQVDTQNGDVAAHIHQLSSQPIGQFIAPMLEYFDQVREPRTGVVKYDQGIQNDSVHQTYGGINLLVGKAQARVQLIARVFAEMGVKPMMGLIHRLNIKHQDKPRTVRLREEWVEVDPRVWNADMDATINVGLGHGTREQEMMGIQQVAVMQEKIAMAQKGLDGPLVDFDHVGNLSRKLTEITGNKASDRYFASEAEIKKALAEKQPQQPAPDPKAMAEMAKVQVMAQGVQLEHRRKMMEIGLEHQRKMQEMGMEAQIDQIKAQMEALGKAADVVTNRRGQDIDALAEMAWIANDRRKQNIERQSDAAWAGIEAMTEAAWIGNERRKQNI